MLDNQRDKGIFAFMKPKKALHFLHSKGLKKETPPRAKKTPKSRKSTAYHIKISIL